MRVALVSPYDLSAPGGVQGQVLGLAKALRAAGDEVVVLGPGSAKAAAFADGVTVVNVGPILRLPANGSRAPVSLAPRAWRETGSALVRFAPDVVHVHEPFVPVPALRATLGRFAPVLGTFHRAGAGRSYRLLGPALAPVLSRLGAATAVSEEARATLEAVSGRELGEIDIVANGVDLDRFAGAASAAHRVTVRRPTVVFLGRHERRKGLAIALEAFSGSTIDASFQVVGDGPERAALQARFGGDARVRFLGRLPDAELAVEVAGADLLVAPSLGGESFGVVLLEAMAARTAVLASDLPGYRAAAGGAARLVPPGDVAALRVAFEQLLADPAERERLAHLGRLHASGYGFGDLAANYQARYRELLSRQVRPSP